MKSLTHPAPFKSPSKVTPVREHHEFEAEAGQKGSHRNVVAMQILAIFQMLGAQKVYLNFMFRRVGVQDIGSVQVLHHQVRGDLNYDDDVDTISCCSC